MMIQLAQNRNLLPKRIDSQNILAQLGSIILFYSNTYTAIFFYSSLNNSKCTLSYHALYIIILYLSLIHTVQILGWKCFSWIAISFIIVINLNGKLWLRSFSFMFNIPIIILDRIHIRTFCFPHYHFFLWNDQLYLGG